MDSIDKAKRNRYPLPLKMKGGMCMKGSIHFQKDRKRYVVAWYCSVTKKPYFITRYKNEFMYHEKIAEKCLSAIQNRWEQHQAGHCVFRIDEFTGNSFTDVIDYYKNWVDEVIAPKRKPATVAAYMSYYRSWIVPFFTEHPIMMHEIQLDTITKFLNYITAKLRAKNPESNIGKSAANIISALHACLDYAWRSRRIPEMPPFPKREDYNLKEPEHDWLPEDQQLAVIGAMDEEHRPIFLFLKYHYRRPSEACALKRCDYDEVNKAFIIRRGLSARKLVESTKTRAVHYIPCAPEFLLVIEKIKENAKLNEFIFQNRIARKAGNRYTLESLNRLWKKACEKVGVKIRLYEGTKHSSCEQFINEKLGNVDELQALTGHARRDSVMKYAKIRLDHIRHLMRKKAVGA